jgi:hypothetical protein
MDRAGTWRGIFTGSRCAIKAMMIDAGLRPSSNESRRDDPFFAHFPELRTLLREKQLGRRGKPFFNFIENDIFMNHWNTQMRYCDG